MKQKNFTPMMKLVEKIRKGSKIKKKYDTTKTPCERLLSCPNVSEKKRRKLRKQKNNAPFHHRPAEFLIHSTEISQIELRFFAPRDNLLMSASFAENG